MRRMLHDIGRLAYSRIGPEVLEKVNHERDVRFRTQDSNCCLQVKFVISQLNSLPQSYIRYLQF